MRRSCSRKSSDEEDQTRRELLARRVQRGATQAGRRRVRVSSKKNERIKRNEPSKAYSTPSHIRVKEKEREPRRKVMGDGTSDWLHDIQSVDEDACLPLSLSVQLEM